jgi:hypothetical protein
MTRKLRVTLDEDRSLNTSSISIGLPPAPGLRRLGRSGWLPLVGTKVGGMSSLFGRLEPSVTDCCEKSVFHEPVELLLILSGHIPGIFEPESLLPIHPPEHSPQILAQK